MNAHQEKKKKKELHTVSQPLSSLPCSAQTWVDKKYSAMILYYFIRKLWVLS